MKLKRVIPATQPEQHSQMLVWSDSVATTTGFGIVSKYLLREFSKTGRYDIHQLAINHFDILYDERKYPYRIFPARLDNPRDPYGCKMLLGLLKAVKYDVLFIMNDAPVTEAIAAELHKFQRERSQAGEPFSIIFYYPIDSHLPLGATSLIKIADRSVCFTQFGARETMKYHVKPSDVIYIGTDTEVFHSLSQEERKAARKQYFHIDDEKTFVWINVNRNSIRKNVAQTLYAFHQFKKQVCENSILYLHMSMLDGGAAGGIMVDLRPPMLELGLKIGKDIIFPNNFNQAKGCSESLMNTLYNAADGYITTTLGEGWGCSITEAMAAGIPVVAPANSSLIEIAGAASDRGYLYPCKEIAYVDASGYRPLGRLEDIVEKMRICHLQRGQEKQKEKLVLARKFTEQYSWTEVGKSWSQLLTSVDLERTKIARQTTSSPGIPNQRVIQGEWV